MRKLCFRAIRQRLTLRASCCCVKPSNSPAKTSRLPPSSSCLPSAACHPPSDPITASPHQGGRRRHLDRQLHALRSRIHRSGAENLATPRQPVRPEVVTHVLGTFCRPCVRAGQVKYWSEWQDLNLRPPRPERGSFSSQLDLLSPAYKLQRRPQLAQQGGGSSPSRSRRNARYF
jgi:hypothetical protein